MVALLLYFELDLKLERVNGEFVGTGHIQCKIRYTHPAFSLLLYQLVTASTTFYLNNSLFPGVIGDKSSLDINGNFRKLVELDVNDEFTISVKQARVAPCNIGGSPYSINKMILAQELDAQFGTADHRKRKRSGTDGPPARKRYRI